MDSLMIKLLEDIQNIEPTDSNYTYNGVKVPRVTHILSKCIHSDSLLYWANSLGLKRQPYGKYMKHVAQIGTECHENIEAFLNNEQHKAPNTILAEASNAYQSYLKWFNDVSRLSNEFTPIYYEKTITCRWFGGTIDALYSINNMKYLVDYKTSNHITYKHVLQTSAYRYMLREVMGIDIDGIIILQLSKDNPSYQEHMLNFRNPDHLNYINDCERTFFSLVYAYYNLEIIENGYSHLQWR